MNKLILYVQSDAHKNIVQSIFNAAKFPQSAYRLIVKQGKYKLLDIADLLPLKKGDTVAILIDLDIPSIPDAKKYIQKQYSESDVQIFYGVPEVESWIFADDLLVKKYAGHEHAKKILERLPLPDEVLHPKQTAYNIFRTSDWGFLSEMNLTKATARSSSLRDFLTRVSTILKIELREIGNPISNSLDRRLFVNLLKELNNGDTEIFRASSGHIYTARDMINQITNQTDVGIEYTNSMLRIVRDLLSRKAKKNQ